MCVISYPFVLKRASIRDLASYRRLTPESDTVQDLEKALSFGRDALKAFQGLADRLPRASHIISGHSWKNRVKIMCKIRKIRKFIGNLLKYMDIYIYIYFCVPLPSRRTQSYSL